jgi:hypothetical protein
VLDWGWDPTSATWFAGAGSDDGGVKGGCEWRKQDHRPCHPQLSQRRGPLKSKIPSQARDRLQRMLHGLPSSPSSVVAPPPLHPQIRLLSPLTLAAAPPLQPHPPSHRTAGPGCRSPTTQNPNSILHRHRPAMQRTACTSALCLHWVSRPLSPSSPQVVTQKLF